MSRFAPVADGDLCKCKQAELDVGRCVEEIADLRARLVDSDVRLGLRALEVARLEQEVADMDRLVRFYRGIIESLVMAEDDE
jgi:hypothetical protein